MIHPIVFEIFLFGVALTPIALLPRLHWSTRTSVFVIALLAFSLMQLRVRRLSARARLRRLCNRNGLATACIWCALGAVVFLADWLSDSVSGFRVAATAAMAGAILAALVGFFLYRFAIGLDYPGPVATKDEFGNLER